METSNIIMKVIDYIEDHLDRKLSLDEIADKAGYSKFHLNRMFSERVGLTLYKYIQTRRLTVAAEKLVNTKKPIIDIAYESHYDSQQSFTYAFKQLYLCTPQRYRIIGAYTPKLNRYTISNHLMTVPKFAVKCGGRAA